jgi:hypothetical protein
MHEAVLQVKIGQSLARLHTEQPDSGVYTQALAKQSTVLQVSSGQSLGASQKATLVSALYTH